MVLISNLKQMAKRSPPMRRYLSRRISQTGFWFVDVPRTGSTSLRAELGEHFGSIHGKLDVDDRSLTKKALIPHHQTAMQVRDLIGARDWDALFTFSFLRNPWSRSLSFYLFIQKRYPVLRSWTLNEYSNT